MQTLALFATFFGIRAVSYLLYNHSILRGVVVFIFIMFFAALYVRRPRYAWYVLLAELFLGGAGNYVDIAGLSLRTIMICTFLFLWVVQSASKRELHQLLRIPHRIFYVLAPMLAFVVLGSFIGVSHGHSITRIISDAIPFTYLLLILPGYYLLDIHRHQELQRFLLRLAVVFIVGSAIFSLYTFILYSGGFEVLQDTFYKWFRDIAGGKITDMGTGFFRIVLPEHLFMPAAVLIVSSILMKKHSRHMMWLVLLSSSLLVLVLNLSRAYFLGTAIGFFVLMYQHNKLEWLKVACTGAVIAFTFFFSIHLAASGGQSTGLELLGLRTKSFIQPTIEESTYTRMVLLPPIITTIQSYPWLGVGLGSSLQFYHPQTGNFITTTQYDWGYLEFWAELGVFALLNLFALLGFMLFEVWRHIKTYHEYHEFHLGLFASLIAMIVIAIFAPVFMHVFGMLLIVGFIDLITRTPKIFDHLIDAIHHMFHPLHPHFDKLEEN